MEKELEQLNMKLAEWRGFYLSKPPNPWWVRPDKIVWGKNEPNFTLSLDVCFKWLVPKAIAKICLMFKVDVGEAYRTLFQWWGDIGKKTEVDALALCLAIEKLIDGGK